MTSWRAYYWVANCLHCLPARVCVRASCVYVTVCLCALLINMHCHTQARDKHGVGVGAGVSHWLSALAARQLIRERERSVSECVCKCVCACDRQLFRWLHVHQACYVCWA